MNQTRLLVQDQGTSTPVRVSDSDLLLLVNNAIRRTAIIRPDLFATTVTNFSCVAGYLQSAPADSFRIIDIPMVTGVANINEADDESFSSMNSTWQTDPQATAQNWFRNRRNAQSFSVWPPAPAGQQLTIVYAQSPPTYTQGQTVALIPDAYFPAIVDFTVNLYESLDNEHANSGRAKLYGESAIMLLGAQAKARDVLDSDRAGESKEAGY